MLFVIDIADPFLSLLRPEKTIIYYLSLTFFGNPIRRSLFAWISTSIMGDIFVYFAPLPQKQKFYPSRYTIKGLCLIEGPVRLRQFSLLSFFSGFCFNLKPFASIFQNSYNCVYCQYLPLMNFQNNFSFLLPLYVQEAWCEGLKLWIGDLRHAN